MDSNLSFLKEGRVYNIDLGATFQRSSETAFHTVRYDFKPASVDLTQQGEVNVGETNEVGETNVSITLPHQQGSKNSSTVYKGSKKPALKECVLIFDKETGAFTLERITSQIQVKKTRSAGNASSQPPVIPSTAPPKLHKKGPRKSTLSKTHKPPNTEPRKIEYSPQEEKPEISQPVQQLVSQVEEDEPVAKRLNLSASSSSGESSSDNSSSDDDSSSSDESSSKSPAVPAATGSSLFEDLELSDSDSD